MSQHNKIWTLPYLASLLEAWRRDRAVIGFTNGCFDQLHEGHHKALALARVQCDRLVVGLNSDTSVRALKGYDRPLVGMSARAHALAALASVDAVSVFATESELEVLIGEVRPTVLVKGRDYEGQEIVGAEFVRSYGGRVVLTELVPGFSTSG